MFGPAPGMLTAAGQVGLRFAGRAIRARSARASAEAARSFAASGTLPAMTPSARARAFGSVFTLGTGLEAGRSFGGGVELPFGGYKKSGYGREKGLESLASYTQVKNVCVKFG